MASSADPTTAIEKATGIRPNISSLRIFGYEALSYVEKDKRHKFDPKFERCINLGPSPAHSHLTYKLLNLRTRQELFRRHVVFNERSFPMRPDNTVPRMIAHVPPAESSVAFDLIGKTFNLDEKKTGKLCTVTSISNQDGAQVLDYTTDDGKEYYSTVSEVQSWVSSRSLSQSVVQISTATFNKDKDINRLAYDCYKAIMYATISAATKPRTVKYG